MIAWLSVLAAFTVVGCMLVFLAYCGRALDAEARRVALYRSAGEARRVP